MIVALDFETELIAPGYKSPRPACVSVAWSKSEGRVYPSFPPDDPELRRVVHYCLDNCTIIAHNAAGFEAPVMLAWLDCEEKLFRALDEGRFLDTMALERIAEIQRLTGRKLLDFATLCKVHGLPVPDKDPAVRREGAGLGR